MIPYTITIPFSCETSLRANGRLVMDHMMQLGISVCWIATENVWRVLTAWYKVSCHSWSRQWMKIIFYVAVLWRITFDCEYYINWFEVWKYFVKLWIKLFCSPVTLSIPCSWKESLLFYIILFCTAICIAICEAQPHFRQWNDLTCEYKVKQCCTSAQSTHNGMAACALIATP